MMSRLAIVNYFLLLIFPFVLKTVEHFCPVLIFVFLNFKSVFFFGRPCLHMGYVDAVSCLHMVYVDATACLHMVQVISTAKRCS